MYTLCLTVCVIPVLLLQNVRFFLSLNSILSYFEHKTSTQKLGNTKTRQIFKFTSLYIKIVQMYTSCLKKKEVICWCTQRNIRLCLFKNWLLYVPTLSMFRLFQCSDPFNVPTLSMFRPPYSEIPRDLNVRVRVRNRNINRCRNMGIEI